MGIAHGRSAGWAASVYLVSNEIALGKWTADIELVTSTIMSAERPYIVHTNRELGLMLKGTKPLAMFYDAEGFWPDAVLRYLRLFDKHVASGRFIRRDHFAPPSIDFNYTLHRVFFALPREEWRIDEMIQLKQSHSWSSEHERREGELLGYEEWMNDFHLNVLENYKLDQESD
jgi:hypothetical protein